MKRMPVLFNVNGFYGCGSSSLPDYKNVNELLINMNRLGIDRALVWHLPAGSDNEMLKEIEDTPGAKSRLVPALTVYPDAIIDSAYSIDIIKKVATGEVKALRVLLAKYRNRLAAMEPLLEQIRQFMPVLLFDTRDPLKVPGFNTDHLLALAEKFPEIPMVYLQCEWVTLADAYELMRYRKNIYLDISWLHVNESLENLVKVFGAERLLFGVGPRSHNGASIASLIHADINNNDMELIAHINLERLLRVEMTKILCKKPGNNDTLWDKLIRKEPIDVDVIDSHTHIANTDQADQAAALMKKLGIKQMISVPKQGISSHPIIGSWQLLESVVNHKSLFLGYVVYNGHYYNDITTEKLDELFHNPFYVGFKILNFYWNIKITDIRFNGLWEYADKHLLPILIHTWNDEFDSPAMLKDIVEKYKHATFILGHSGGEDEGRIEAETLAQQYSNVYLEFCGSFPSNIRWEDTIMKIGSEQVIYGTDFAGHNMIWELGRLLSTELPDEYIIPILGANMRRILAKKTMDAGCYTFK